MDILLSTLYPFKIFGRWRQLQYKNQSCQIFQDGLFPIAGLTVKELDPTQHSGDHKNVPLWFGTMIFSWHSACSWLHTSHSLVSGPWNQEKEEDVVSTCPISLPGRAPWLHCNTAPLQRSQRPHPCHRFRPHKLTDNLPFYFPFIPQTLRSWGRRAMHSIYPARRSNRTGLHWLTPRKRRNS